VTGALAIVGSFCHAFASPSVAQEAGVWTHPSGAYSLNYRNVSWKIGTPFSYNGKPALVTFEPSSWDRGQGSCLIFETRMNLPAEADQVRANETIAGYTAEKWAPAGGFDPARVTYFQNEMVGPVRVATMIVDSVEPKLRRSHYRSFAIVNANGAFQQELSCSISPNASTRHKKDLAQFLSSLRFGTPASDQ
jgi:hypothetical protein